MSKKNILLLFLMLYSLGILAQTGTIRGKVTDAGTGEELVGATVVIDGTNIGARTDIDGNFNIPNLTPGTYNLKVVYVSFGTKIIESLVVTAGQVIVQNVTLAEETTAIEEEVVVEAKAERKAENYLLTQQKKSPTIQDGISSELFSRTGDRTAASAMQRVTGVSVEGGKYVYVRGLGDRYTKTTLNRAEIPGLDPDRNTVQMDLFPSNLIDNIIVLKTFSPDVPGNFTGGYVNINTKDFPETFTMQASASFSFNDQTTFNSNFISTPVQGGDIFGLGKGGDREIPSAVDGSANAARFDTDVFNNQLDAETRSPFLNQSYAFSLGNQSTLFGKQLGYIVAVSYRNSFNYFDNGAFGRFDITSSSSDILNPRTVLDSEQGTQQVLWGALGNLSLKLSDNSKIGLNLIRNQSGENQAIANSGIFPDLDINTYQTLSLFYTQRSLTTAQLRGDHVFGSKNIKVDWITSYSISTQDQPDLRYFTNGIKREATGDEYVIPPGGARAPSRFFRDMVENNWDTKVDVTIPLLGNKSKVKLGGSFLYKERDFNEQIFQYSAPEDINYGTTPLDFVNNLAEGVQTTTNQSNSYVGEQIVASGYGLIDWRLTPRLRLLTGARLEVTDLTVESDNPRRDKGELENTDILPAFNLTYELKKDMNLRFAYGRTLARPTFRELAPYPTFQFVGDFILTGDPSLERTLIDNFDIRWEMFPSQGEIITVSTFYKTFQAPIAIVIETRSAGSGTGERSFDNLPNATVYGAELEFRKKLNFITSSLENFTFGFNFSYIQSEIDIPEEERSFNLAVHPDLDASTRPLNGQSPYIVNTFLNYDNKGAGWQANVNFNIFGERISAVGVGVPDVLEQPRPILDAMVSKEFGNARQWRLSLRARNILNPEFKFTQTFRGDENIYRNYTNGRTYSIGIRYLID